MMKRRRNDLAHCAENSSSIQTWFAGRVTRSRVILLVILLLTCARTSNSFALPMTERVVRTEVGKQIKEMPSARVSDDIFLQRRFVDWRMALDSPTMFIDAIYSVKSVLPTGLSSLSSRKLMPTRREIGKDASSWRRDRGVLGFVMDDEPAISSTQLESVKAGHIDDAWNLPRSIYLERNSLNSGTGSIWAPASSAPLCFSWIPTFSQIDNSKVVDLKQACTERGLSKTGNKAELQERMRAWSREQMDLVRQKRPTSHSSLRLYDAYGVATKEREAKPGAFNREGQKPSVDFDLPVNEATVTPNSLAEWTRTVDLEPLLQRREVIRREKLHGKPVSSKPYKISATEDYLSVLQRVFDRPSSPYSNLEVQQMYAASKQADQNGDRLLAKRLLLELKTATPHDARIFRRLARMEKEDGHIEIAQQIVREGLEVHPQNGYLWHSLGHLAASDEEARQHWEKAIEVDPSFPHAYHSLGTFDHTQGHIAKAMKTLKQGVEYCPTNHRLHHALGDLYRDAKMLELAERCYQKSLKHGSAVSHGFAYTGLAYVAYEQGQIDRARNWLHKAILLNNGRHANAWVALAQMEEAEGNVEKARATCMAGLSQYERNLLSKGRKGRDERLENLVETIADDAAALKERLFRTVPIYRSGDRFYNLYRNWARLEERFGSSEDVEEVYERAAMAFPRQWQLTLSRAKYYVKRKSYSKARARFAEACRLAGNRSADPYRAYAEWEMTQGCYEEARKVLYQGAEVLSQVSKGGSEVGMADLFQTWAICEWHLGELARAEVLFDHALRMTALDEQGSSLRSFILYSMARLEYYRGENHLAQHCIGLCLKENAMPGGNLKVWDLWTRIAASMGNEYLARECQKEAAIAKQHAERNGASDLSRFFESKTATNRLKGSAVQNLIRRDPWHQKIFGAHEQENFYSDAFLPDIDTLENMTLGNEPFVVLDELTSEICESPSM